MYEKQTTNLDSNLLVIPSQAGSGEGRSRAKRALSHRTRYS